MRLIVLLFLLFSFIPMVTSSIDLEVDNIYGDYLLSGTKKTVSLDFEGVSLIDALKAFSQQTGLSFVSTEAAGGKSLTFYLENVPLRKAMDIVFEANGLTYDYFPEANIFVVRESGKSAVDLEARVYHLKYLRLKTSRMQQEIDNYFIGSGGGGGGEESKEETGLVIAV